MALLCEESSAVLEAQAALLSWAGQAGAARTFPGDAAGFEGLSNEAGMCSSLIRALFLGCVYYHDTAG